MKKRTILPILLTLTLTSSILIGQPLSDASVLPTRSIAPVNSPTPDDLSECSRLLDKTLSELESCKEVSQARLDALNAEKAVSAVNERLIARLEKVIAAADEQIRLLKERTCTTISFMFGLIKFKKC